MKTTFTPGTPFTNCGEFCQWVLSGQRVYWRDALQDRDRIKDTSLRRIGQLWSQCLPAIEQTPEPLPCPSCKAIPMVQLDYAGQYECGCQPCVDPELGCCFGRAERGENTKSAAILDWNEQVAEWAESEQEAV